MKKFLFTVIAAAVVLPAHALTVKIDTISRQPSTDPKLVKITDTDHAGTEGNEIATALLINNSFVAYCAEPYQSLPRTNASGINNTLPAIYNVGSFSANKISDLTKAASYLTNLDLYDTTDAQQAALNQAIFWEILNEDSGTYSFSSGDFQVAATGYNTLSFDFNLLNSADAFRSVYVTALTNNNFQDLLTVSAVPEPSTYALMLAGLAGVGFLSRRRRAD